MILDYWLELLVCFLGVYLFSNINFAIILAKFFKHADIRKIGSGNPGTTNMLRAFGVKMGALTFLLDCLKGVAAGLIGMFVFRALVGGVGPVPGSFKYDANEVTMFATFLLGLAAVLGHIFPVFIGFKGGKGFATGVGFFIVVNPYIAPIALAAVVVIVLLYDYMSLGAILFFAVQLSYSLVKLFHTFNNTPALASSPVVWWVMSLLIAIWALVMWAHRGNIGRLIRGKENRSNFKKLLIKKKRLALNEAEGTNEVKSKKEEVKSEDEQVK